MAYCKRIDFYELNNTTMEELRELMKDAFYSAITMEAFNDLGGSEEDFNEYWNRESTQQAVKNIAVLDDVSQRSELLRFMEYLSDNWYINEVIDCTKHEQIVDSYKS